MGLTYLHIDLDERRRIALCCTTLRQINKTG